MSEPLQIEWEPLPDDGRECPLLRVNPWNQIDADAYLLLQPSDENKRTMICKWMIDHRPGVGGGEAIIRDHCHWQTAIAIDLPARARRKRLTQLHNDPLVWLLLNAINHGWTIAQCEITRAWYGTLDERARDALRALRQHVRDVCAPRLPARDAREQQPAQPI